MFLIFVELVGMSQLESAEPPNYIFILNQPKFDKNLSFYAIIMISLAGYLKRTLQPFIQPLVQPILILAVPQTDLLKKWAELWAVLSITSGWNSCTQNECNQEVADIRQIQCIKRSSWKCSVWRHNNTSKKEGCNVK